MNIPSFVLAFILIPMIAAAVGFRSNVFRGIGVGIVCTLLIPTWLKVSALGISCDLRVCLAIAAAAAATLFRRRWLFDRLVLADLLVVFLCGWEAFSEWNATGNALEPILLSYGYWILPYLVGRCSARSIEDVKWLGFSLVGVCGVFAFASLLENTLGVDLFEVIFGDKPGLTYHPHKAERWGYIRCEGPYRHPIFFGAVCMLIFPWTVWLASTTVAKQRALSVSGIMGVFIASLNTISRGPILGIFISVIVAGVVRFRKLSICLMVAAVLCTLAVVVRPESAKDATLWFARISGEREKPIAFDGEGEAEGEELDVSSSSLTRLLIIEHYWKSVKHAGMMGYGMTATTGFPPNVPHVPFDQVRRKQFPIVDNSYILLALRGGWLLSFGFVLLLITAVFQFHGLERQEPTLKVLCRLMIGAICAFALVVFTVYPDYDYMFVFLWTVGISSVRLDADRL